MPWRLRKTNKKASQLSKIGRYKSYPTDVQNGGGAQATSRAFSELSNKNTAHNEAVKVKNKAKAISAELLE